MNLFCLSLEGSTDSLYEPSQSRHSQAPMMGPSDFVVVDSKKWGCSQSCIALELPLSSTKQHKVAKRKSNTSVSTGKNGTDGDEEPYTTKSKAQEGNERDHYVQVNLAHFKEMVNDEFPLQRINRSREGSAIFSQELWMGLNFEDWMPNLTKTCESIHHKLEEENKAYSTLKKNKLEKKSNQSKLDENRNALDASGHEKSLAVITCIGLCKKPWKKKEMFIQQAEEEKKNDTTEIEDLWHPGSFHHWRSMDASLLWESSYHTCHRPTPEIWNYVNFTLPRSTDRQKYEELVHDLDLFKNEYPPKRVIRSVTNLDMRTSSFGLFDRHQPKSEDHENPTLSPDGVVTEGDHHKGGIGKKMKAISMTMRRKMGKNYAKALSEEMTEDVTVADAHQREDIASSAQTCTAKTSNSVESLYSLHSGQSFSSGITSGSEGSSNRDSMRIEEEIPYTGQFCGKAKVHTDFIPSPYDTESLKLKAGDLINIISKPPMGIWTGMLNGKVGNFKFIYVEVLTDEPTPVYRTSNHKNSRRPRPKTLQEFLERLKLEEFTSSLLLNGYQTVEDLKDLKEKHLIELNVTDAEQRQKLLAAAECLQDAEIASQEEVDVKDEPKSPSETVKADLIDCPRDSGCYINSDCSDNSKEDAENHLSNSSCPSPAEV